MSDLWSQNLQDNNQIQHLRILYFEISIKYCFSPFETCPPTEIIEIMTYSNSGT